MLGRVNRRLAAFVFASMTALVASAGCPGDPGDDPGPGGGPVDASIRRDASGPVWVDAAPGTPRDCLPPALVPDDGQHNPGKDCQSGCHNHGFTVSGTVYTGAANNTAYAGATVRIIDANNRQYDAVTSANGNFHLYDQIAYPAIVKVSSCPNDTAMVAPLRNANDGRCNMGGCHAQTGGAQIHLP